MSNQDARTNRIENIYKLVESTAKSLDRIKEMLRNLEKDEEKDKYRDVEGVTGTFDGVQMISQDNQKYEVPANYAAKSRLVFGDTLKMVEEEGKKVFKQIEKVERKKVEGILTKKEGKWHIISDSGTFKISDIAAEFQHAELNDEAVAFIPASNLNSPYAALDKVNKKTAQKIDHTAPAPSVVAKKVETPKAEAKPAYVRPEAHTPTTTSDVKPSPKDEPKTYKPQIAKPRSSVGVSKPKPAPYTNVPYKPANSTTGARKPKPPVKKEFVEDITSTTPSTPANLEEDDLR